MLVAAGAVRAEVCGPSTVPVAVISRSCRLDGTRLLHLPVARSIVITVAQAPAPALARAAEVAEVSSPGERDIDLATTLDTLGVRGFGMGLAEGGPTLNGQLAAAGLHEPCLTVPQPGRRRRQADPR